MSHEWSNTAYRSCKVSNLKTTVHLVVGVELLPPWAQRLLAFGPLLLPGHPLFWIMAWAMVGNA